LKDKSFFSYLITDPKYYSNNKEKFEQKLRIILSSKKIDIICFRDKDSSNFKELAKVFVLVCKEFNIKNILINSDYNLAKNLNATGVHLNSKQFDKIQDAKNLNLDIIISCHNEEEIIKAQKQNIKTITYSPIFNTPNKGKEKGINKLKKIIRTYQNLNIIALGGIIKGEQLKQIQETKAYGFASIRYFI
jgi:thiamine-phosphate pyrophosphorylase